MFGIGNHHIRLYFSDNGRSQQTKETPKRGTGIHIRAGKGKQQRGKESRCLILYFFFFFLPAPAVLRIPRPGIKSTTEQ